MPKKQKQISSVKWTEKNKVYLRKLGIIDQHGKSRNESVSGFVNECVTKVCESGMSGRNSIASSDELRKSWAGFNILKLSKEIQSLVEFREEFRSMISEDELMSMVKL